MLVGGAVPREDGWIEIGVGERLSGVGSVNGFWGLFEVVFSLTVGPSAGAW